jgi:hypothetical protein
MTTNFEFYKNMVERTNLDKIFGILAEEIFETITPEVMPEGIKNTIQKATYVIIPMVTGIYKKAFLSVYKGEFTDEEFGKLAAFYGPGSTLWSFFNTSDFFPWLKKTIKGRIQARVEGLDLASMTTAEFKELFTINLLLEALDQLPEWVKTGSEDYINSDLYRREAALGDKITAEGDRLTSKVNWYEILEKAGIELPNKD